MDIIPTRTFRVVKNELGCPEKYSSRTQAGVSFGKNRVDQNLICRRHDVIKYIYIFLICLLKWLFSSGKYTHKSPNKPLYTPSSPNVTLRNAYYSHESFCPS